MNKKGADQTTQDDLRLCSQIPEDRPICILMDFPTHFDTISMRLPIVYIKGSQVAFNFLNYDVFLYRKVVEM